MLYQSYGNNAKMGEGNNLFRFIYRDAIYTLLLCLIGLLSTTSFAQPLAASKSKFVGNVISSGYSILSNFSNYWNQVTPENAGKWGSVQGSPGGGYTWTQLDNIYNYAKTNEFEYKHHTLVWGQQQPAFLVSLDTAAQYQEVENWIKETGARYPDADLCDVVNEPLHAPPVYKDALGGDGATGWDWVIKSFELARQYWSSNTKLILNEYNIINSSTATSNYLIIINLLKDRELIDGIGIQCHNFEINGPSTATLKNNLDKLAETGIPIYISEFDINEADDNTQLQKYQSIFPLLYEHPGVEGITLWGYVQYDIWQADAYLLTERYEERPAMEWLRNYLISPLKPILISPVYTSDESLDPTLIWHASDSAETYNVQVALNRNFLPTLLDTTVSDTLLQLYNLDENTVYYWRVNASNENGTSDYTSFVNFLTETATDVKELSQNPSEFVLMQNYPNPFNPETTISYTILASGNVSLKILDVLGRELTELVNEPKHAGAYSVKWDASRFSSGIYLYRIQYGEIIHTKKMVLMR